MVAALLSKKTLEVKVYIVEVKNLSRVLFAHREPVENLADNLLRDFEDKWWKCCREVQINEQHLFQCSISVVIEPQSSWRSLRV